MHALSNSTTVEAKLFLREPLTVAFTLALPLLFLFVMGGVFGNKADPQYYRGAGALDYYVPAYCGLVWAAVGLLALPVHLARYREDGVLRRLRASAARPWVVLGAQLLVTFMISLAGSVLIIAMAALVYHIHAPHSLARFFGALAAVRRAVLRAGSAAGEHPVLTRRAVGRAGAVLHDDDAVRRGPAAGGAHRGHALGKQPAAAHLHAAAAARSLARPALEPDGHRRSGGLHSGRRAQRPAAVPLGLAELGHGGNRKSSATSCPGICLRTPGARSRQWYVR
jgi:hypothetical protein